MTGLTTVAKFPMAGECMASLPAEVAKTNEHEAEPVPISLDLDTYFYMADWNFWPSE